MRQVIFILGLALVIGAILVAWLSRTQPEVPGETIFADQPSTPVDQQPPATPTPEDLARADIRIASRFFAERYGSFSSDRPVGHLQSAAEYASSALRQSLARQAQQPAKTGEPTLISSTAYVFILRSLNVRSGLADAIVTLQRTERVGGKTPRVFRQDLNLQLVREEGRWKANLASWGPEQK